MKKFSTCLVTVCLLWSWSAAQTVPQKGILSITPGEMKSHVIYLASDDMRGRNTPSPELDSSAAYIAREFASYGLKPACKKNGFYQIFNLLRTRLGSVNTFSMQKDGRKTDFRIKNDFVPDHTTGNGSLQDRPVVFAGYGITAPEYGYDDYQGIDAAGKVVLIFRNEPGKDDSTSIFEGTKDTDHSKLRVKIENALDHGAEGVIFLPEPASAFRRPPNHWPSLLRNPPENGVPLTLETSKGQKAICITVGKEAGALLMETSGRTLEEIVEKIDGSFQPQSCPLPGITVSIETSLQGDRIPVKNVAGLLEGSDPVLKEELVIIGGHYDHVGAVNDSVIYNGADDNASGTAGMMEIAEAFTEAGEPPARSLLFLAFAGEEKGLFGSKYYTENPLFPLENTVAMLNLDMISRNDSNEVAIIGSPSSDRLKAINEEANRYVNMDLAYDQERYFLQSDHYPFYRKGVPVLFYNTKDTPDLHQPTDTSDKILPQKMAKIGRLAFSTAWILANMEGRPDYIKFR